MVVLDQKFKAETLTEEIVPGKKLNWTADDTARQSRNQSGPRAVPARSGSKAGEVWSYRMHPINPGRCDPAGRDRRRILRR